MVKKIQPVKLEDLAKQLNVSKVTISKALRGHPDISHSTTAKVKALAEELGYMPNIMARNLSSRRSNTIGLVVPKIAHVFFASIIEAIYDAAFENNYEIVLTVSQEKALREKKHILSLLSMRVDGLIISITEETTDLSIFEKVLSHGVRLVFIDRVPNMPNISSVTVNDRAGAFAAIEYAIKKGYKKIAHIGGYQNINIGKDRFDGFRDAMSKYKIPIKPKWVTEGGFSEEDGYKAFKEIYKKGELPEYILAVTYPVALGVYDAALELGVSIPGDIEITCFGNNTFNKNIPLFFNFVNQSTKELGTRAVKMMIEQINNPKDFSPQKIVLDTELFIVDKLTSRIA